MKENYKYLFFKYLYDELGLYQIEQELEHKGVNPIDGEINGRYSDISKYFSLENNVDDSRLSDEQNKLYIKFCSSSVELLMSEAEEKELKFFLDETYRMMLFPNIKENISFYGPINYNYVAPRDSIVLGLNYYAFDIGNDNFDEIYLKREEEVCEIMNRIQITLADSINKPISVLKYNEHLNWRIK